MAVILETSSNREAILPLGLKWGRRETRYQNLGREASCEGTQLWQGRSQGNKDSRALSLPISAAAATYVTQTQLEGREEATGMMLSIEVSPPEHRVGRGEGRERSTG